MCRRVKFILRLFEKLIYIAKKENIKENKLVHNYYVDHGAQNT